MPLLDEDPVVIEWDDASQLERAVAQLDAERSRLVGLCVSRRVAGLVVSLAATMSALGLVLCAVSPESIFASVLIAATALFGRAIVVDELDGQLTESHARCEGFACEVQRRMEVLDRLLDP